VCAADPIASDLRLEVQFRDPIVCGVPPRRELASRFDVIVVGGGINGAGIARDLAGRGLAVGLCEKDDLASHTSGCSTKQIHGGLRHLEHHEFSLLRKALAEREVLLRSAPHIIWPLRLVMPHDPGMRPVWMVRASACWCTTTWRGASCCRARARSICAITRRACCASPDSARASTIRTAGSTMRGR